MKRYISAATKGYNKSELVASIQYLFNKAIEAAGALAEDIQITKIDVHKYTRPISYSVHVKFTSYGKSAWILLSDVPTNQSIPEDYWVTADDGRYFDELVYAFDDSTADTIKQAFAEFCEAVDSISANYGLTYECHTYPKNIDDVGPTDTFIKFYGELVDAEIDDPNIELNVSDDFYWEVILTDKTTGSTTSADCTRFNVTYYMKDDGFAYDFHDPHQPDVEPLVAESIAECRAKLDKAIASIHTSTEYLDRIHEIAALFESVPSVTRVDPVENIARNPRGFFVVYYDSYGRADIRIDNVFEADDNKLLKNLKARIRRYNARLSDSSNDDYGDYSEVLFEK